MVLGQSTGAIIFPSTLLQQVSPAAEPELLKVHENIAEQQLANLENIVSFTLLNVYSAMVFLSQVILIKSLLLNS